MQLGAVGAPLPATTPRRRSWRLVPIWLVRIVPFGILSLQRIRHRRWRNRWWQSRIRRLSTLQVHHFDGEGRPLDDRAFDLTQDELEASAYRVAVQARTDALSRDGLSPVALIWLLTDDATFTAIPPAIVAVTTETVLTGQSVLIHPCPATPSKARAGSSASRSPSRISAPTSGRRARDVAGECCHVTIAFRATINVG